MTIIVTFASGAFDTGFQGDVTHALVNPGTVSLGGSTRRVRRTPPTSAWCSSCGAGGD
jgi:hypothetical protein